jgi:hypothetical protein
VHAELVKRLIIVTAVVVLLAGGAGVAFTALRSSRVATPTVDARTLRFVTASPMDLEQIARISKFRSCSGHDYSGKDIDGVVEHERSMKSYAIPLKSLDGTKGQVKVIAPFDAVVIDRSQGKLAENLDLEPVAAPGWVYELGHITVDASITAGSHLDAGQLIGTYDESGAFDLQLWFGGHNTVNTTNGYFDSIFSHVTPAVEALLERYGISASDLVVTREYRDAHPCVGKGTDLGSTIFVGDVAQDQVVVHNRAIASGAESGPGQGGGPPANDMCAVPPGQRPPGCP